MKLKWAAIGGLFGLFFGLLGVIIGIVLGYFTGWVTSLDTKATRSEIGTELGWLYGLMIGGLAAFFAGGTLHFIVVTILMGYMGSIVGGQIIAGLVNFSHHLDRDGR